MNNQYRKIISVSLFCLLAVISVYLWNSRDKEAPLMPDGVYTHTERGFKSDIELVVTVTGGKIVDIQASHGETPGVSDSAFNEVIPNIIATQSVDVDTATGATVSSKAIINGVAKIIEKNQAQTQMVADNKGPLMPDGVYSGTEPGFKSDIELTVTVSDGKIVSIDAIHNDTPGVADLAIDKVIPGIIEAQSVDVDTATHATVTSEAIINGVRKIIEENTL